jgi:hypothetical protein
LIALAALPVTTPAHADSPSLDARRDTYEVGLAAMVEKNWEDAYRIFAELWAEQNTYDIALSLGQAELQLQLYRDAAEHLDWGLRHLPPRERPGVAKGARDLLDLVKQHVTAIRVVVERPGAEVRLDGEVIGRAPVDFDLYVEPGSHTVAVQVDGYDPALETFEAIAGTRRVVALKLRKHGASASPPPERTGSKPHTADAPSQPAGTHDQDHDATARSILLWTGVAITAAAATSTLVFALNNRAADGDADDLKARAEDELGPNPCSASPNAEVCGELAEALDDRNAAGRLANVFFGVTVVAGLATAATWFAWPEESGASTTAGAVQLFPVVRHGGAQLMLRGAFR